MRSFIRFMRSSIRSSIFASFPAAFSAAIFFSGTVFLAAAAAFFTAGFAATAFFAAGLAAAAFLTSVFFVVFFVAIFGIYF